MAVSARWSNAGRSRVGTTTLTSGRTSVITRPAEVAVAQEQWPAHGEGKNSIPEAHVPPPRLVQAQGQATLLESHRVASQGVTRAELDIAVTDEAEVDVGWLPA